MVNTPGATVGRGSEAHWANGGELVPTADVGSDEVTDMLAAEVGGVVGPLVGGSAETLCGTVGAGLESATDDSDVQDASNDPASHTATIT